MAQSQSERFVTAFVDESDNEQWRSDLTDDEFEDYLRFLFVSKVHQPRLVSGHGH